ncbi:MAG: hypothetical protein IKP10_07165 [Clostridia bacterium]|nr:hypothetical protein [Clostridia bacterium]
MYKKQMKFQRIICLLAIISSALVFIYALGIMTDNHDMMYTLVPDQNDASSELIPGAGLFVTMQPFVHWMTLTGLLLIVLSLMLLLTNTHSRRRYYATNIIATAAYAVCAVIAAVYAHGAITGFRTQFLTFHAAIGTGKYEHIQELVRMREVGYLNASTFWFDIHYFVFGLALAAACLLVANLIMKFVLMKKEAAWIGQPGNEAEGADVALDRMRFAKNQTSARLALLAIVANVLFFIAVYRINDKSMYESLIGISVIYNLLFMLATFLSSEGVKNYKPVYSYVLFVLAAIQVARIFIIPVSAHAAVSQTTNVRVMDTGKFIRCLFYLILSAVCLIVAGIVNLTKSKALQSITKA